MRIRLRNARSLWTLLTSYFVLLLLSVMLIFMFYKSAEEIIINQSRAAGQEALVHIRDEMDRRLSELRLVSGRIHSSERVQRFHFVDYLKPGERGMLVIDIVKELTNIKKVTPFIDDILVYFPKKKAAFSATAYYTDERYYKYVAHMEGLDLPEFRKLMGEHTFIGDPYEFRMIDAQTGDRYVCFTQSNNTFLYPYMQVILLVSESTLSSMFTGVNDLSHTGPIALDKQGKPITSEGRELYGEMPELACLNDTALSNDTVLLVESSENFGWSYILLVPTAVLLREAVGVRNWMILLLLAFSGIGMSLSVLMSFIHYRPIQKLATLAENILSKTVIEGRGASSREYEIQLIERALNGMQQAYRDTLIREEAQLNELREHLVKHFIYNTVTVDEPLDEQMRQYKLKFPYNHFLCTVCRFDLTDLVYDMQDAQLVRVVLCGVASDMLVSLGQVYFAETAACAETVVINVTDDLPESETLEKVCRLLDDMRVRLAEEFQLAVTVSVGGVYRDIGGIHKSWVEAERLMDFARLQGLDLISPSDMGDFDRAYDFSLDTELQLHNLVRSGNEQGTRALLSQVIDDNLSRNMLSETAAQCLFVDLLSTGIKLSRNLSIPDSELKEIKDLSFERILEGAPPVELRDKLLTLFGAICRYVCVHPSGQEIELKRRMLAYIHENYTDATFSQTRMAETLGLSPSYLSASFRNHTGKKMVDYINRMRVEKAKELLENTALTLEEIAPHIGCTTALTLIRIFKKHTGITPGQYRDCLLRDSGG